MPKIYSNQEKDNIRRDLRKAAEQCLARYGVRKTTVDELVRMVNIPKGTFYLFYPSKEHLFLDVLKCFEEEEEERYFGMLQELDENHIVTSLTSIFLSVIMNIYKRGIYRFLEDDQMEIVTRKVPSDERELYSVGRMERLSELFSVFSIDDKEDIENFDSAFRSLFYVLLHDDEIPDMEKALGTLVRGLVLQLVE